MDELGYGHGAPGIHVELVVPEEPVLGGDLADREADRLFKGGVVWAVAGEVFERGYNQDGDDGHDDVKNVPLQEENSQQKATASL